MKIGVIGLGFMGATHVDAFSKLDGVQVSAVCTRDARAAAGDFRHIGGNLGRNAGVHDFSQVRNHQDWRELVSDPSLDAVDICLPTDLHAPVSVLALQAGKHVLCEKPMALNFADCEGMIAAAREAHRVLMIGHVLRFWPEYLYLQKFVRDAQYGPIQSATFSRSTGLPDWSRWLPNESKSGGAVLDLLIHDIDQALHLFGTPQTVAGRTLHYSRGLEVNIEGGWLAPGTPFSSGFRVKAEKAELALTPEGLMLRQDGHQQKLDVSGRDAYEAELAYFADCCRKNAQPEQCPPRESAEAVKIALQLKS
ncbi:MAG TPA: Gfo/Idh/MocA family oxidoreductase [Bryobacteraceae bacterium]|nr:Gfo/Idh/MocA family oxidoreductase [Bryobacteraceae bacterium]